jgi:catechol 2,3-dioxygenase-like lactoylglutathione lyase family enzyme
VLLPGGSGHVDLDDKGCARYLPGGRYWRLSQQRKARRIIVQAARDTFWGGYAGYFKDPDGHLWEIAWNPHWRTDE